jgi:hypothetical protein
MTISSRRIRDVDVTWRVMKRFRSTYTRKVRVRGYNAYYWTSIKYIFQQQISFTCGNFLVFTFDKKNEAKDQPWLLKVSLKSIKWMKDYTYFFTSTWSYSFNGCMPTGSTVRAGAAVGTGILHTRRCWYKWREKVRPTSTYRWSA